MKKINNITLYDSIDNMPQLRKHLFDQLLLMESGIGGGIKGIETAFQRLDSFIRAKKYDSLVTERQNLHFKFLNGIAAVNFKSLAFICLVSNIDGKPVKITQKEDAEKYSEQVLSKVSHKELNDFIEEVKKNYFLSLGYTFQNSTEVRRS